MGEQVHPDQGQGLPSRGAQLRQRGRDPGKKATLKFTFLTVSDSNLKRLLIFLDTLKFLPSAQKSRTGSY